MSVGTEMITLFIPTRLEVSQGHQTWYLTLPHAEEVYRLALRPLTGPLRIPELTVRLQNPQVQYSPAWVHTPTRGTTRYVRYGFQLVCSSNFDRKKHRF